LNHASKNLLKKALTETIVLKDTMILEVFDKKDGNLISRTEG